MTKRLLPLAACAALALAGCGSDKQKGVDTAQIRSVVSQFAISAGPKACRLLSPDALVNIYGGYTKPTDEARAACIQRSGSFKGQKIKITQLRVISDSTAKVTALNRKGDVTYTVTVRRFGPSWRIDEINQAKTQS